MYNYSKENKGIIRPFFIDGNNDEILEQIKNVRFFAGILEISMTSLIFKQKKLLFIKNNIK